VHSNSPVGGRVRKFLSTTAALVPLCTAAGQATAADWPFGMTDLGALGGGSSFAYVVNATGTVIGGAVDFINGTTHAVSWSNGATTPTDLGALIGNNLSVVLAISADGRVLVGQSSSGGMSGHGVSWTNGATTPTDLGALGGGYSNAAAVSADGRVIVGVSNLPDSSFRAVSWTNGATVPTDLGTLAGGNYSDAVAVNDDGSVIVGSADLASGDTHAASWINGATTPTDLGTLGGNDSEAVAVSGNGQVIVGEADLASGDTHAASWTNGATTPTDLGTLGGSDSWTTAVSANGRVIVGDSDLASGDTHAVSWTNGATSPTDLGTLGGSNSSVMGVSADGAVILGNADTSAMYNRAVVWMNGATAATDLGTLGGNESHGYAISADGRVVVGYSETASAQTHAFVLRLRGSGPVLMQDMVNVAGSFPALANDTAQALDRQQGVVAWLIDGGCKVQAGHGWCLSGSIGALAQGGDRGSDTGPIGSFSLGRAITENTVIGLSVGVADGGIGDGAISGATNRGLGLWAAYSQGGAAGTGLQVDGGIGYSRADKVTLTRGTGLANVQAAPGTADVSTVMASVRVGYGFERGAWLLTPSLGIAAAHGTRSAYSEDPSLDFPAEFRKLGASTTTATLALSASRPLGEGRLGLVAGLGVDLDADRVRLEGTSTVPGLAIIGQDATLGRNRVRPMAGVSYRLPLGPTSGVAISASLARDTYGDKPAGAFGVSYNLAF